MATNVSPASGTEGSPRISTGVDGPASFDSSSLVVNHCTHFAVATSACNRLTNLKVPFCTRTVATGPRPYQTSLNDKTSRITLRVAFNSSTSAVRRIISKRFSIPSLSMCRYRTKPCFRPNLPESVRTRTAPVLRARYWRSAYQSC